MPSLVADVRTVLPLGKGETQWTRSSHPGRRECRVLQRHITGPASLSLSRRPHSSGKNVWPHLQRSCHPALMVTDETTKATLPHSHDPLSTPPPTSTPSSSHAPQRRGKPGPVPLSPRCVKPSAAGSIYALGGERRKCHFHRTEPRYGHGHVTLKADQQTCARPRTQGHYDPCPRPLTSPALPALVFQSLARNPTGDSAVPSACDQARDPWQWPDAATSHVLIPC